MGDEASRARRHPRRDRARWPRWSRGDGGRRGRLRDELRAHAPRRRRQADPQPLSPTERDRRRCAGRWARRAAASCGINGPASRCTFADVLRPAAELGVPFTYTALLDGAERRAPEGRSEMHREGLAQRRARCGRRFVPAADVLDDLVEPFTLNTSPVFAELMPAARRSASGRVRRSGVAAERAADGWSGRQGMPPRWDTYEIIGVGRASRARRPAGC